MATEKAELVFIPFPAMGHLPSAVETARKLTARLPDKISITILLMKFHSPNRMMESLIQSISHGNGTNDDGGLNLIKLPELDSPPTNSSLGLFMDSYKPTVKQILLARRKRPAALILDVCCLAMIDVANEIGVPSYIYSPTGAPFLHLMLHFGCFGVPDVTPVLAQDGKPLPPQDLDDDGSYPVLELVGFKNPIPSRVWPDIFLQKEHGWHEQVLKDARRLQETKGIMINTFVELETDLIHSFSELGERNGLIIPTVYPVGPMIDLNSSSSANSNQDQIISWLDLQPPSSVVFLCFGSWGSFDEKQLKEIAIALEQSGQRFLWSVRHKPAKTHGDKGPNFVNLPEEYECIEEVLPEGFLDRTAGVGKVIGWAPQTLVLGHQAVGAFVSHCGWNSTLESFWFGVPLVAWPMYGEQQLNAFTLVKELGLAVEIKMDYKCYAFAGEEMSFVGADVIERAIRKVMEKEEGNRLRARAKQMSEMAQKSLEIDGSSYKSMGCFIEDVLETYKC